MHSIRSTFLNRCLFLLVSLGSILFLQSCNRSAQGHKEQNTGDTQHVIRNTQETHAQYAQGFSISYHQNYKVIKMFSPFTDQSDTLNYVLIPQGNQPPETFLNAQVIDLPIEEVIVTGAPQVAFLEMLNALDVIEGVVGAKYVYNTRVHEKIKSNKIERFTQVGFSKEKILAMNPDLVIITGGQISKFDDYRLLMKAGISVIVNAGWLETTPLGRAEWVKVYAALLNKEFVANKKFSRVAEHYRKLKKRVAKKTDKKPLVINGLPYEGAWFVSGGNSYMAQYLKDAQAAYPWFESDKSGGLKLNFEAVYYKGLKADVWINPGTATSIQAILAQDGRFKDFKSVQTGRVYNRTKRVRPSGANDFWETGVVRPDLVLHDFINIFHPRLLESDTMYFYQKLSKKRNP